MNIHHDGNFNWVALGECDSCDDERADAAFTVGALVPGGMVLRYECNDEKRTSSMVFVPCTEKQFKDLCEQCQER